MTRSIFLSSGLDGEDEVVEKEKLKDDFEMKDDNIGGLLTSLSCNPPEVDAE